MVGIIAGGGSLPVALRRHLEGSGTAVRGIALNGEARPDGWETVRSIGDIEGILADLQRLTVSHVVLAGWVRRRPRLSGVRLGRRSLPLLPTLLRALGSGDDGALRRVAAVLERRGHAVVGVHDVWPEIVAGQGALGRERPDASHRASIALGVAAARRLGDVDAGQGVVVVGRRVVALEGLEGTDGMLERVAQLRAEGRLPYAPPAGVLVKAVKPGQELRADLPSIGTDTVRNASRAGLRGIAVEAGASLVLEREAVVAAADEKGLFVHGFRDPAP